MVCGDVPGLSLPEVGYQTQHSTDFVLKLQQPPPERTNCETATLGLVTTCFLLLLLSLFDVLCLSVYCDGMCSIFDKGFQTKAHLQRQFRGNKGKCHIIPSFCYCCDGYQDQGNYAHVI